MGDVLQGDIIQAKAKQLFDGQKIMNTFFVRSESPVATADNLVHGEIANWLQGAYNIINNDLSNLWETDTIETYNVTQDRPMTETSWPTHLTGTQVDRPMPNQMASLVTFPTETKRSLGKKFIAGLTDANNRAGGKLSSPFQVLLASWAANILAGPGPTNWIGDPGNWSILYSRFAPWVSAIVEELQATQRRRKAGVGE